MKFGQTAESLARNPLGIFALFIVLVYGIAGLVLGISSVHMDVNQRWFLVLFIVLFPPLVLVSFLWLVANHSAKLYAPTDFRADESFLRLNAKVSSIELRQDAAGVDPRGDSDSAFQTLGILLEAEQLEVAKNLAKAFLKVKRYEISLKMFKQIINHDSVKAPGSLRVVQYRAYSLMGLGRYEDATQDLQTLQATGNKELFDFSPRLALAYCQMKLGNQIEFEVALSGALVDDQALEYRDMVAN